MIVFLKTIVAWKYFWPCVAGYVLGGILMAWELNLHECSYPIMRGIIWPIPLIRFLCGVDF
jgi:hypothetical protein